MRNIWLPFGASLLGVVILFATYQNLEVEFTNILDQLKQFKWQFAFMSFLILSADILLPVPSSMVMYMNGYVLGVLEGSLISFGSLLVGSSIGYYLGKFTSLGLKAKNEERSQFFIQKYGALAILITRGIPMLAESICIVCGYNKMPVKKYMIMNAIGYIPLCLLYAFLGQAGYNSSNFLFSFAISLLVPAAFWFFGKRYLIK